jgi:outer membrane protein TolC
MKLARALATTAALAVGGCMVGPNYKVPPVPAPPAYSDNGHNGDWAAASPADANDRGAWWSIYGDTELDGLEQRCATANQSIAAALHAYEQAHDLVRENRASLFPTVAIGGGQPQPHLATRLHFALQEVPPTTGSS